MTTEVTQAVKKAREFFNIKDFPGNLFKLFEKHNCMEKYNLLLFKEDIAKLSGFIGYGKNGISAICINYKRPIGHQNFTLAHELGHWFIHRGQNISDDDKNCLFSNEKIEKEANNFAAELLYPEKLFVQDYFNVLNNGKFQSDNRKELAICINDLCHKYCLSFDAVFRKLLYKNKEANQYKVIKKEIEESLGCKISKYFDKDFYTPNDNLAEYQQLRSPYNALEEKINILVELGKIGEATAESIKLRNGIRID